MRKALAFAFTLALLPLSSYALGDPEKCAALASAWPMAITAHNQGLNPEDAFKTVSQYRVLTESEVKFVVNQVYFNPHLIGVNGEDLQAAVYKQCYYETKPFQPLK